MSVIDFNVGDIFKLTQNMTPHGVIGDLFTVVRKIDDTTAEMDRCGCPEYNEHQIKKIWGVGTDHFVKISKPFTAEEIKAAKPLPSVDEALSFFKKP